MGIQVAEQLLSEIDIGGLVDSSHEWLVVIFMALTADYKISKASFGSTLSPYTQECLRLIQEFLGIKFKISALTAEESLTLDEEEDGEDSEDEKSGERTPDVVVVRDETFTLECIGANVVNSARRTF